MRGRLMGNGKILDDELEDELQRSTPEGVSGMPFDKWHLVRKLETDEKGALLKNVAGCVLLHFDLHFDPWMFVFTRHACTLEHPFCGHSTGHNIPCDRTSRDPSLHRLYPL